MLPGSTARTSSTQHRQITGSSVRLVRDRKRPVLRDAAIDLNVILRNFDASCVVAALYLNPNIDAQQPNVLYGWIIDHLDSSSGGRGAARGRRRRASGWRRYPTQAQVAAALRYLATAPTFNHAVRDVGTPGQPRYLLTPAGHWLCREWITEPVDPRELAGDIRSLTRRTWRQLRHRGRKP